MKIITYNDGLVYELYSLRTKSATAVFFSHGFPADSGKNEDVAQAIASFFRYDCYLLHQAGLGRSRGAFYFSKAIRQTESFINFILTQHHYENIFLVGHSWGAFINLSIALKLKISGQVMIAPLTSLPERSAINQIVTSYADGANISGKAYRESLVEDACALTNPVLLTSVPILVTQGTGDEVVSADQVRKYFTRKPTKRVKYIELGTDHWFPNRAELIDSVTKWLSDLKK